jgi:hypothetical protein
MTFLEKCINIFYANKNMIGNHIGGIVVCVVVSVAWG